MDAERDVCIRASAILGDCLEQLVLSAVNVLSGISSMVCFFEEPDTVLCHIEPDGGVVRIELAGVAYVETPLGYARQVRAMFSRYLMEHGAQGYVWKGGAMHMLKGAGESMQRYINEWKTRR